MANKYSDIKIKAYNLYRMDWIKEHGYTLDDVLKLAFNIMASDNLDIHVEDDLLDAFEEVGFNGEMYVSFDEFIDNEYEDTAYMILLFGGADTEEYNEYCNDNNMTTKIIPDDIPSLEEIKTDLNAIIGMAKDLKTYDDIKKFESEHVTKDFEWVEINGEMVKDFNPDTPIEWIRIDCYGCLNYIYFFWNDNLSDKRIMFDIFCGDDYVDYLATDVTPDDLTEENYYRWVENYKAKRGLS